MDDRLANDPDVAHEAGLTEEMKAELDKRLTAYHSDPSRVLTWEQVESHVRRPR